MSGCADKSINDRVVVKGETRTIGRFDRTLDIVILRIPIECLKNL